MAEEKAVEADEVKTSNGGNTQGRAESIGLDANVAAAVGYIWIIGLILFLIEKDNKFVRFHALQSVIGGLGLGVIVGVVSAIPFVNLVSCLLYPAVFAYLVYMAYQAYKGEMYEMPIVADFVKGQLK